VQKNSPDTKGAKISKNPGKKRGMLNFDSRERTWDWEGTGRVKKKRLISDKSKDVGPNNPRSKKMIGVRKRIED